MNWIRGNRGPIGALCIVIVAVLGAVLITVFTASPTPHVVRLGKAVSLYHAPSTGGGISVPHYFVRALRHHTWCGAPTTPAKRGIHGVFRQRFQHCEMGIGPVKVYGLPTSKPQPTHTPTVSNPNPTQTASSAEGPPTSASQIATPVPATSPPFVVPVPTTDLSSPVAYELSLMNATRAQYGLPPYSLDSLQSNGTATCGGSIGHSQDMAASGAIWHVNSSYPQESFPNNFCGSGYRALGENVGMAGGYSVTGSLDVIHNSMMQEPHSLGCQGNHACSIISQQYTRVGIGVYTTNGSTWLTVDFEA